MRTRFEVSSSRTRKSGLGQDRACVVVIGVNGGVWRSMPVDSCGEIDLFGVEAGEAISVRQQVVDGGDEGVSLGEDRGFELRVVADPGIEGADAADGGVEFIE